MSREEHPEHLDQVAGPVPKMKCRCIHPREEITTTMMIVCPRADCPHIDAALKALEATEGQG